MSNSFRFFPLLLLALALSMAACDEDPTVSGKTGQGTDVLAPDSTLSAINRRIAADPNNFQNYLDRAKYFSEIDNYTEAFRDINRALETDSTQGAIYVLKGQLHWLLQDVRSAYDTYKKCLSIQPDEIECLLKKSEIDITLGNFTVAMDHINNVLRQNDLLAQPYYLKGRLYKEKGDTTLSASSYQTAIELDPNFYDAYIEIGLLYAARKHDLAREYYSAAIEVKPRSIEAWYNKAMFLQETGFRQAARYDEAHSCYNSILEIDSLFAPAWFNKGFIELEYRGNYAEAANEFTKATQLNPTYYQAFYNRGLCNESLGKKVEAEQDYRKALALKPDYTEAAIALNRVLGQ